MHVWRRVDGGEEMEYLECVFICESYYYFEIKIAPELYGRAKRTIVLRVVDSELHK